MKKLLLSALIAAASLTAVGCSSETTNAAKFKEVTFMTTESFGWGHCDWDYIDFGDLKHMIKEEGWTVVTSVPMNFTAKGGSDPVECSGLNVVLTR